MNAILKFIEAHPTLIAICLFFLGGVGFLIKRTFFSGKKSNAPHIKAGRDISAGGDIIVGNKTINQSSLAVEKNIEAFEKLIENTSWRKEFINHREIYICESDNTFQIEIGGSDGSFQESWVEVYPDRNGRRCPVYLKINNTTIKELTFIACDGGRIFVPIPEQYLENEQLVFLWRLNSLPLKVCKIIGDYYIYKNIEGIAERSKVKIVP